MAQKSHHFIIAVGTIFTALNGVGTVWAQQLVAVPGPGLVAGLVDARAGEEGKVRTDPAAGKETTNHLGLGLRASVAYEDNVFLQAQDPVSDVVSRLTPWISYDLGGKDALDGAYLHLAYFPTAVLYADRSDEDRADHDAQLEMAWRWQHVTLAYAGRFQRLGEPTADAGGLVDRNEWENALRLAWTPREKMAYELSLGQKAKDYDDRALYNSTDLFGEAAAAYTYSPKTKLSLAYRFGSFDVDGGGKQDYHRLAARMEWKPREKVRVDFLAGAEHRRYDLGSDTTPVFSATLGWNPRPGTDFALNAYRRVEASGFLLGENYDLTGVSVNLSQRIGTAWTASLEAGFEDASYHRVSGEGPSGRHDKITFIRPRLLYRLNDKLGFSVFYRWNQNNSNTDQFGFADHSAGVEVEYTF